MDDGNTLDIAVINLLDASGAALSCKHFCLTRARCFYLKLSSSAISACLHLQSFLLSFLKSNLFYVM